NEVVLFFFFSSRRRHTRSKRDWSSDVCSSDLLRVLRHRGDACGLEQRERRHPAGDRRRERLAEKGTERAVLPSLDVARAPVVDRSEERRVGKECRSRGSAVQVKKKTKR